MNARRKKTLLLLAVGACLLPTLGLTVLHLVRLGTQPKTGLLIVLPPEEARPVSSDKAPAAGTVNSVTLDSPAFHAGFQLYDQVLDIDGIPLTDRARLKAFDLAVQSGQLLHYRVLSGGRERVVTLRPASLLRCVQVIPDLASTLLVVIVYLGVSLFVFLRRPEDPRVILLLLISAMAAGTYLLVPIVLLLPVSALGVLDYNPGQWLYWAAMSLSIPFTAAMAAMFLHLGLIFPKPLRLMERNPRLVYWVYSLSVGSFLVGAGLLLGTGLLAKAAEYVPIWGAWIVAGLAAMLSLWRGLSAARRLRRDGWRRAVLDHPFRTPALAAVLALPMLALAVYLHTALHGPQWIIYVFLVPLFVLQVLSIFVSILVFPILTCVAMIAGYRQAGSEEKRQIRWPLWGTCVALGGNIVLLVIDLLLTYLAPGLGPWLLPVALMLGKPLYLLIPVSFAIGILKYRLMDIDLIIRQTVVYSVVSGIVLALCFLQAVAGVLLFRQLGLGGAWGTGLAALVLVALLVPLQRGVQGFVDRRFFRSRADYPAALAALRQQAGDATERADFLRGALDTLQQALRPRTQAVLLPDASGGLFRAVETLGVPEHLARRLTGTLPPEWTERLLRGETLNQQDLAGGAFSGMEKLAPAAILPMVHRRSLAGLLLVGRKYPNRPLEKEDIEFLRQAAGLLADGLVRLEVLHQTRDLEMAQAIQRRFLPQQLPSVPGLAIAAHWEPSRWVGGDYYDVVELGEGRLGVAIADVAGKGMSAALLMSNLQAAFRALATAGSGPAALCARLNDILRPQMVAGKFITLFYGEYDAPARRLTYVNAGHCPSLLFSESGEVRRLEEGGLMLGAFANPDYRQQEVALQPGDLLVLYTDGVPEAENTVGEEFGEERLVAAFRDRAGRSPGELVDSLLAAVREHTGGEAQDDLTVVVLSAM